MLRRLSTVCTILALIVGLFAFAGCGGGGGGGGGAAGPIANTPTEGDTTGNGVLTGLVSNETINASLRFNLLAESAVATPAQNLEVEAGDYNELGEFVSFNLKTTTNARGFYRLTGLPTGRRNIIIRVLLSPGNYLEGVVPEIIEGQNATAPVIDPNTRNQARLVKFAEKFDATFEINVGDIVSKIPPAILAKLTENEIRGIAEAFVNREKAQQQTFRDAGLGDTKFQEFKKFAFDLQREIIDGINNGLYSAEEGWKLFDDQLRLRARTMGLKAELLLALQDVDNTIVGETLPQVISNPEAKQQFEHQFEFKHAIVRIEAIVVAMKLFVPTALSEATYTLIRDGVERMIAALQGAAGPAAIEQILNFDPVHGLIKENIRAIYVGLKLFEGTPPLFTRLYPTQQEMALIKTNTGYTSDNLASLTVAATRRAQVGVVPTPTQLTDFHEALRKLVIGKIQTLLPALTPEQAAALFVLLIQGPDLGLFVPPGQVGTDGSLPDSVSANQIMGILVASGADLFIDPPPGFPPAPAEWGHLAKVATDSMIDGQPVTATSTPHVYNGIYAAPPSPTTPPVFKITGYAQDMGTPIAPPIIETMTFTGGPLERDAAGKFWFGLDQPVKTEFRPRDEAIGNAMQGLLGQIVEMQGNILEKRPAPDFGPAVVVVSAIRPMATGFIPPNVELPVQPATGTQFTDLAGIWTFDKNAEPHSMFKFSWVEDQASKSAFVGFDPNTLDKTPRFRHQDPAGGHDLWESNGHLVKLTGTYSPVAGRMFITRFVDESTVWPPVDETFIPPSPPATGGTALTDLVGTWTFDPQATEPRFAFRFLWMDGNTPRTAFVDFDPATLDKYPQFRFQNSVSGRDMWESNGHQVTITGKLTPLDTVPLRIFLTRFHDPSTTWPNPQDVVTPPPPPATGTYILGQVGTWTFDRLAEPRNAFRFTYLANNALKTVFVDFNPDTLEKVPQFRFQNPASGRDMWESDGHQVTLTGKLTSDGLRLFIASFTDLSTTWPDSVPPVPATGTQLIGQAGTWTFDQLAEPRFAFKFTYTVGNLPKSVYVDFDPSTLVKIPQFRFQNQASGRDMWESHGHLVTVSGTLTPDGERLFITNFTDNSTTWPTPPRVIVRAYTVPGAMGGGLVGDLANGFVLLHARVQDASGAFVLLPPDTTWPDANLVQIPTPVAASLTQMVSVVSPAPIEVIGAWGPDLLEGGKIRKQLIPAMVNPFGGPFTP